MLLLVKFLLNHIINFAPLKVHKSQKYANLGKYNIYLSINVLPNLNVSIQTTRYNIIHVYDILLARLEFI